MRADTRPEVIRGIKVREMIVQQVKESIKAATVNDLDVGISKRSLQDHVAMLEAEGILKVVRKDDYPGTKYYRHRDYKFVNKYLEGWNGRLGEQPAQSSVRKYEMRNQYDFSEQDDAGWQLVPTLLSSRHQGARSEE